MSDVAAAPAEAGKLALRPAYFVMAALAFAAMFVGILGPSLWFLTWVHIMAGVLWTGIDLFLGFVIGPILRRLNCASQYFVATHKVLMYGVAIPVSASVRSGRHCHLRRGRGKGGKTVQVSPRGGPT